jgi:hypothetical protein
VRGSLSAVLAQIRAGGFREWECLSDFDEVGFDGFDGELRLVLR